MNPIPRPRARKYLWDELKIGQERRFRAKRGQSAENLRSTLLVSAAHYRRLWNHKFEVTTERGLRSVTVWRVR